MYLDILRALYANQIINDRLNAAWVLISAGQFEEVQIDLLFYQTGLKGLWAIVYPEEVYSFGKM